eukprot:c10126_g4_i2.p1 GENE.c10126_g4_i2~~c10126_g4_i2.p1  ORF type:complete len:1160 (-),score=371.89 c10126_g4_i2:73-3552(-)
MTALVLCLALLPLTTADNPSFTSELGAKSSLSARGYLIQFRSSPAAAYTGGRDGFPATKTTEGGKINVKSATVSKYTDYLKAKQREILESVGAELVRSYSVVYNGAFALISPQQATKLREHPEVLSVRQNRLVPGHTFSTPNFLGLTNVWNSNNGLGPKGENVIIGMVDSGLWPEHSSFAPLENAGPVEFSGDCQGENDSEVIECHSKVLACRAFFDGFGADAVVESGDVTSCRDKTGHGTHTAATAGGNSGVSVTLDADTTVTISGMAPRARLAIYKVCFLDSDSGSCSGSTADIVSGIEQATIDGVDILSYSMGAPSFSALDDTDIAFFHAALAGVFVSASAGNAGAAFTVSNLGPWMMTVGASTHDRSRDPPFTYDEVAPTVATFSSRGPPRFALGLLKPDIIAPGVRILAPVSNGEFSFYSGTSMSCPHISGLAAIIREAHPEWEAMEVKSAMMLTAYQTRNDGSPIPGTPNDFGAGHVDIQRALNALIAIVPTASEGYQYICYYDSSSDMCASKQAFEPTDANVPSMVLVRGRSISRRIKNIFSETVTVSLSVAMDAECSSSLSADEFEILAGETASFAVETNCHALETGFITISVTVTASGTAKTVAAPETYHVPVLAIYQSNHPEQQGDGNCNADENNAYTDFDGGDCCPSTCQSTEEHSCGESGYSCQDPDICVAPWISDGYCDPENNKADCNYDGGDCCEDSCVSTPDYECGVNGYDCQDPDYVFCPNTETVGNGYCDEENNIPVCSFDGGDCCESTCVSGDSECGSNGYDCADPSVCRFDWLGDGWCDSETNIPDCGFDGGDCCEGSCESSAYECGVHGYDCVDPEWNCLHPEWNGDGWCDEENNIPGCDYDGGDCCLITCESAEYDCGENGYHCRNPDICRADWINDAYCDSKNNIPDCNFDGGDCCEESCVSTEAYTCGENGYDCVDPNYFCAYPDYNGDGYCDPETNTRGCQYDGGDCCASTCVSAQYECGTNGFNCLDSEVCHSHWIGDGWCDNQNNNIDCYFDGGDCCDSTCTNDREYQCGVARFNCLDPEADGCRDHNEVLRDVTGLRVTCDTLGLLGFCRDDSFGYFVRVICPSTCGISDRDNEVAAVARALDISDIISCKSLLSVITCDDAQYGSFVRYFCPCSCNYRHFLSDPEPSGESA